MKITIKGNSLEISNFILELQKRPCSNEALLINARVGAKVTKAFKCAENGDLEPISVSVANFPRTQPGLQCEYLGCKNAACILTTDDQGVAHRVCSEHTDLSSIIRKGLK